MSIKASDAAKALKLIKMPAPKAKAVLEKVAPKKTGKASKGAQFAGTNVNEKFNKVASKSMGAGVVGRSLVARAGSKSTSKPMSKAQAVARIYDAADPATKRDILKCAVGTALTNTPNNFSTKASNTKVNA